MNEFQHTMAFYYLLLYNICGKITTQEKKCTEEQFSGIICGVLSKQTSYKIPYSCFAA